MYSSMGNRFKFYGKRRALIRRVKHILYLAVFVFHTYLRLMRVGVVGMDSMRVRVQLLDKGIRNHRSAEQQKQN